MHISDVAARRQVLSARLLVPAIVVVLALAGGFAVGRAMRPAADPAAVRAADRLPAPAGAPRISAPAATRQIPRLRSEPTRRGVRRSAQASPTPTQTSQSPPPSSGRQPSGNPDEPVEGGF